MKKLILSILFILCLSFQASAWNPMVVVSGGGSTPPDCSEDFAAGDTGDVASATDFDSETDGDSKLDIYSNELRFYADTPATYGSVNETGCLSNSTEFTIKFTIRFEDITSVGDGNDTLPVVQVRDSDSNVAVFQILTDESGNIFRYRACRGDVTECGPEVTMTGLAADTDYPAYFYYKEDATIGEVAGKIGSWDEDSTGNDDNSADDGVSYVRFGCTENHGLGGGATDTYIYFDDFEIYSGDQMP